MEHSDVFGDTPYTKTAFSAKMLHLLLVFECPKKCASVPKKSYTGLKKNPIFVYSTPKTTFENFLGPKARFFWDTL